MSHTASIYEDELLVFIANRYHSTPQELLRFFLTGNASDRFQLEENEKEIIRGLVELYGGEEVL